MSDARRRAEFGDFQTPPELAAEVVAVLQDLRPESVVEPSCGVGNLLLAAAKAFPTLKAALGTDINERYATVARSRLNELSPRLQSEIKQADFFAMDWEQRISSLPQPVLVLGNPPWVTNAELGRIGGANLPPKANFQRLSGIAAMTGKSNFDISEWLLLRIGAVFNGRRGFLAMLCKTSVARRFLFQAWANSLTIDSARLFRIDAKRFFSASVDACLLVVVFGQDSISDNTCEVYKSLGFESPPSTFAARDGRLVADLKLYDRWRHLAGSSAIRWRSGIKHDCNAAMELRCDGSGFSNTLGETVDLEQDYVFPMLKSTDLSRGEVNRLDRFMLVPQRSAGDDTGLLEHLAPKTWLYLLRHAPLLDSRASSIYRSRPRFSIFGVGDYTFLPWKVAVSGLHHDVRFRMFGPRQGKPVVLDDTCYFVGFQDEKPAQLLFDLMQTPAAQEFIRSLIFDHAKRPVTVDTLGSLNLAALSAHYGRHDEFMKLVLAPVHRGSPSPAVLQHSLL